ncbi:MAG TPA: ABC transporter permease, partial [Firmicutes bacterium]|nr:ABC transporter permease [Bacillota bacterium]
MGSSEIAWGNLWRHKGRTVFLLLLVIFSVTTVISMVTVTRAMRAEIGNAFDQTGANILILPQQTRRFGYAGVALPSTSVSQSYLPERNTDLVRTIENRESIAVVAPKLLAVLESAQGPVLAVGVRFPAELRLKKWWRVRVLPPGPETRYAPVFPPLPVGASEVLLGAQVAQRWQKDVGDTVQLDGQSFRVAGVLDPLGSDEDRAVWVDL